MHNESRFRSVASHAISRTATSATLLAIVSALMLVLGLPAQAQTFTVLHNFTGGVDGANPSAGLTLDAAGNLYGTASNGGNRDRCASGCGTVFRMAHRGSGWVFAPLYDFTGGSGGTYDGTTPRARVIKGANGTLYGTTTGGAGGAGTVFNLRPPPTFPHTPFDRWNITILHAFQGGSDGEFPQGGDLVFDEAGSLYGTTGYGGSGNEGTAYKLTYSHGEWTEKVIYAFQHGGSLPFSGVIFDPAGNLYGTTYGGGIGWGVVYELLPSGSGWIENDLYIFQGWNDGNYPTGGLIFDLSGNLYGCTTIGGSRGGGTVFKLSPSGGNWTLTVLYSFEPGGGGPASSLVMDAAGNLFGTTSGDGTHSYGNVFKLVPSGSSWIYTDLHDFTGGLDGWNPIAGVTLDANGNLYGTAYYGGTGSSCPLGCGVVWEITP